MPGDIITTVFVFCRDTKTFQEGCRIFKNVENVTINNGLLKIDSVDGSFEYYGFPFIIEKKLENNE